MKYFFQEALNTLNATWLEMNLARLFGKKTKHQDSRKVVTVAKWRGKYYLIQLKVTSED